MFGRATIRLGIGPHSSFLSLAVEVLQGKMCQKSLPSGGGRSLGFQGEGVNRCNILIPLERQLIALQLCRWQFLYNETLQYRRLFILYCRNCLKDDKCRYFIPILRKLGAV